MSLVPPFAIGLLNAWILMLVFLVFHLLPLALLSLIYKGAFKRSAAAPISKTEKIDRFTMLVMILAVIYSVFLPLKLGATWFYVGIPVFLLGLILFTIASVNFAATPLDEPVTRGLYRYSRHPMYLAIFLEFIGVSIASASWVLLVLSIILIILTILAITHEERFLLDKYGSAYREYIKRTPKWAGVPPLYNSPEWEEVNMPISINGIDQLPAEGRKALTSILKWSKVAFWIAAASLIIAIIAVIIAILW